MKTFSIVIAAAALVAASSVCAMPGMGDAAGSGATPPAMQEKIQASFAKMDADKDSKVTRQEFVKAHPNMTEEAFTKIDTDRDEHLTVDEWSVFLAGHASGMRQAPAGQIPPTSAPAAGQKPSITPPAK